MALAFNNLKRVDMLLNKEIKSKILVTYECECFVDHDCFYEIIHNYMKYYHWKNGFFRVSRGKLIYENEIKSNYLLKKARFTESPLFRIRPPFHICPVG